MKDFKVFCDKYGGAVVGFIIGVGLSILLFYTNLYKVLMSFALIIACIWVGNYIQINKESVKEKTKKFIDKL